MSKVAFVAAAVLVIVVGFTVYHVARLEPRSKFFAAQVTRVDAQGACVNVPTAPRASDACFPLSMLDSTPWSSAGTTWRPTRALKVGDCVNLDVNQEDLHEVRYVRWLGESC
jgi:hypothetical protein